MRSANYQNYKPQVQITENQQMSMESHERKHFEHFYQSASNQLLCWGEESNYIDSEFSFAFERKNQENSDHDHKENLFGMI